jgi:hypothetical protein
MGGKVLGGRKAKRLKPEFSCLVALLHMNVCRFLSLVEVEEEAVGTFPK